MDREAGTFCSIKRVKYAPNESRLGRSATDLMQAELEIWLSVPMFLGQKRNVKQHFQP
jgi:hypothetical protein